ncbi:MAG: hypothetical protein INR73_14625 [Williamsia sp.]|nr:hypothetical protein [Williamsia sp.]
MQFQKLIFQSLVWRSLYFLTVLLLNILLSRYFKATGSGLIYYISNNFSFILLLGSACLETGMAYYGSQGSISYRKLSVFSLAWTLLASIIVLLCLNLTYTAGDTAITRTTFLFFSFTYIPGILLTTFFCALFYAKQDFLTPNLIMSVTNLLLVILFPLSNWLGWHNFLAAYFLEAYFFNFLLQGLLICMAFIYKDRTGAGIPFPHRTDLRRLFAYSLVALLGNIISFLLYRVDYWFINNTCRVCQPGDLGNYIQVSKLGQLLFILPGIVSSAVFPRTASGQKEEVFNMLELLTKSILLFTGFVCLVLAITGKFLFPWVFGPTFTTMYIPFVLLIPGILAIAALYPLSAYYSGKNKLRLNVQASLLALILIIAGDAILIPRYGIAAAAGVSTAGYMLYYGYVLLAFKREYRTQVGGFFYPKQSDVNQVKKWLIARFTDQTRQL